MYRKRENLDSLANLISSVIDTDHPSTMRISNPQYHAGPTATEVNSVLIAMKKIESKIPDLLKIF